MHQSVQPFAHQLHGLQRHRVGGSRYRAPHRTCCTASTGVKRKREHQQIQLAPAEAEEFLTWATEAGAKADKLELAMFDGEALRAATPCGGPCITHHASCSAKLHAAQLPSAASAVLDVHCWQPRRVRAAAWLCARGMQPLKLL